jgi:hypothetical protein
MKRPEEIRFTGYVSYARALEEYCDYLEEQRKPLTLEQRKAITEAAIQGHAGKRDAIMWAIDYTELHYDAKE